MLTRIRIEVSDEASTSAVTNELDRYERAVMASEAMRHGRKLPQSAHEVLDRTCDLHADADLAEFLGREVTDEVIEYDASLPGYKGRRVVRFKRLDTRDGNEPKIPIEPPEPSHETTATVHFADPSLNATVSKALGRAGAARAFDA